MLHFSLEPGLYAVYWFYLNGQRSFKLLARRRQIQFAKAVTAHNTSWLLLAPENGFHFKLGADDVPPNLIHIHSILCQACLPLFSHLSAVTGEGELKAELNCLLAKKKKGGGKQMRCCCQPACFWK